MPYMVLRLQTIVQIKDIKGETALVKATNDKIIGFAPIYKKKKDAIKAFENGK